MLCQVEQDMEVNQSMMSYEIFTMLPKTIQWPVVLTGSACLKRSTTLGGKEKIASLKLTTSTKSSRMVLDMSLYVSNINSSMMEKPVNIK